MDRIIYILLFSFFSVAIKAQDMSFLNEVYTWPDHTKTIALIPDSLKQESAIILRDDISLNYKEQYIKRRQSIKILNQDGLDYFKTITLPQNFDITRLNNPVIKQGRFNNRSIPYVSSFKIDYFSARIIRQKNITDLPVQITTDKLYWVKPDGERVFDYAYHFNFSDLQVGDILEYTYKSDIKGSYGTNQFYVHDCFPKLKTDLSISVIIPAKLKQLSFIKNNQIDSAIFKKSNTPDEATIIQNYTYHFNFLNSVHYTQNILAGNTLPHVTTKNYNFNGLFYLDDMNNARAHLTNYTWHFMPDSLITHKKVYNKTEAYLRKFISHFPNNSEDTSNYVFMAQLTDTLNAYSYLNSEKLHYGQNAQYTIHSNERLLKQQLTEEFLCSTYSEILSEKAMFYYVANVQDRRTGLHTITERSHHGYETSFIAIPFKSAYKFFVPRYHGLKYFPDELPFYFENTVCALIPKNTKSIKTYSSIQDIKFITIPASTFNENVRSENAVFKINVDSFIIHTTVKENLSGQFSTILRHFYNNDFIDSTIKVEYFKKCTDKPHSKNQTIKLLSQTKTYPYKASYQCSEDISTLSKTIDLTNWFSFLYPLEQFKKPLTQDYYFDFAFTDAYNYLLEFNKPADIKNITDFNTSWSNDFFEINSNLIKKEENVYLLSVIVKVKQDLLPLKDAHYLTEFVSRLHTLNHLKIDYIH